MIQGVVIEGQSVPLLFSNALCFLVDQGMVIDELLPVPISSKRYILAKEAIHPSGKSFFSPVEYGGYVMESNTSRAKSFRDLARVCTHLQLSFSAQEQHPDEVDNEDEEETEPNEAVDTNTNPKAEPALDSQYEQSIPVPLVPNQKL